MSKEMGKCEINRCEKYCMEIHNHANGRRLTCCLCIKHEKRWRGIARKKFERMIKKERQPST